MMHLRDFNRIPVATGCSAKVSIQRRLDSTSMNWHAYIKFPKQKPVRKSLETDDKNEAKREALRLTFSLQDKVDKGISLHSLTFNQVADQLIGQLEHEADIGVPRISWTLSST